MPCHRHRRFAGVEQPVSRNSGEGRGEDRRGTPSRWTEVARGLGPQLPQCGGMQFPPATVQSEGRVSRQRQMMQQASEYPPLPASGTIQQMGDRSHAWRGGEWVGLAWQRPLIVPDDSWSGVVGYRGSVDAYPPSYFCALWWGQSLVWGFGLDRDDEDDVVTTMEEFQERSRNWCEFTGQAGAVNWALETDLEAALREAPSEANKLWPSQKWYFRTSGELHIWLRVFEWDELPESYHEDSGERELYETGYVLAKHFSARTGTEGEVAHVAREELTGGGYIVISDDSARSDLRVNLDVRPQHLEIDP